MIGKTQLKKWLKEIIEPKVKPYGFKVGPEKKHSGGAFRIYKEDDEKLVYIQFEVYSDDTISMGGIRILNIKLNEKILKIINDERINYSTFIYLEETHPYLYYANKNDISFIIPIKSREQLEDYVRPILLNFVENLKLVDYYLHIPHLIQKHDELQKIYDETGDQSIYTFFQSPYYRQFIYFFKKLFEMKDSETFFKYTINYFEVKAEKYKQEGKMHLHETFTNFIKDFNLIKAYFESMSKEEKEILRQEFLNPKLLAVKVIS